MAKTKVSRQEAGAFRRFRSSADAGQIRMYFRLNNLRDACRKYNPASERAVSQLMRLNQCYMFNQDELERIDE